MIADKVLLIVITVSGCAQPPTGAFAPASSHSAFELCAHNPLITGVFTCSLIQS